LTIMNNLKRIDLLFSATGLLILAIGFIFFRSTIDINIRDAYFVIAQTHIALLLALTFLFISLIYFSFTKFSKPLKLRLGQIHYLITTLTLLIVIFPPTYFFQAKRYTPGSNPFANSLDINEFILFAFLVLLLGQTIFLINIFWTLFGRKKTTP
jgi:heme/copper-type cytochrome/quinol oxidase subunit 1